MTRIIAGFAGSLALAVPRAGTRPTSDRVREALFSALEAIGLPARARVLDLYAGSGALGLESASRGAVEVALVERSAAAAAICRRNAALVAARAPEAAPRITVAAQPVRSWLAGAGTAPRFDLALIDPPYELAEAELAADLAQLAPLLDHEAVVVVERSNRSPEPSWPAGIAVQRRRDYGETVLWWAEVTSRSGRPAAGSSAPR